jgi:hypothetical protein
VTFQSKSTPGELITLQVIANQSFIDDNGASEIIGNLFGFTTSISVTEDVPFFVYAVMNEDEDAVQFMISRAPGYESSSGGSFIGTPSNPVASTNGSLFSFDDITTTDYDDNPVVMVGSFRMQMSASDDWTVQTLNVVYDGIGQFQENNRFNMPLGQFGANAGTITLDNGGTAPVFSVNTADYRLTKNGYCYYRFNLSGDGGTDGAGGEARIVAPFVIHATSSILTWFPGLYSAAGGNLNLMMAQSTAGSVQQLRLRGDGLATSLTWSLFTNGNRFISATCFYPLFTVV